MDSLFEGEHEKNKRTNRKQTREPAAAALFCFFHISYLGASTYNKLTTIV